MIILIPVCEQGNINDQEEIKRLSVSSPQEEKEI